MSVMIVTYDLRKPGRNYDGLHKAIRSYTHCHALDSSWFIDTGESPANVRDKLDKQVDDGGQVYVIRLHNYWAATRTETCTTWLKESSRTWD